MNEPTVHAGRATLREMAREAPDAARVPVAARAVVADPFVPAAWTDGGGLMAARHRDRPHVGVQFHPESILTDCGERIVRNVCESCTST